jgi:hypothetical protein
VLLGKSSYDLEGTFVQVSQTLFLSVQLGPLIHEHGPLVAGRGFGAQRQREALRSKTESMPTEKGGIDL